MCFLSLFLLSFRITDTVFTSPFLSTFSFRFLLFGVFGFSFFLLRPGIRFLFIRFHRIEIESQAKIWKIFFPLGYQFFLLPLTDTMKAQEEKYEERKWIKKTESWLLFNLVSRTLPWALALPNPQGLPIVGRFHYSSSLCRWTEQFRNAETFLYSARSKIDLLLAPRSKRSFLDSA